MASPEYHGFRLAGRASWFIRNDLFLFSKRNFEAGILIHVVWGKNRTGAGMVVREKKTSGLTQSVIKIQPARLTSFRMEARCSSKGEKFVNLR